MDMVATNTYSMILSDTVPLHKGKKNIVSHDNSYKFKFMLLHVSARLQKNHLQAVGYKGNLYLCYTLSRFSIICVQISTSVVGFQPT
jgi:hypothetical protein